LFALVKKVNFFASYLGEYRSHVHLFPR
jgi:hypothetical protein